MTPAGIKVLHASFAEAYSKLANQESITCAQTSIEYGPLPPPNAAIIDVSRSEFENSRRLTRGGWGSSLLWTR